MKTYRFSAFVTALAILIAGCTQEQVKVSEVKVTPSTAQITKGGSVSLSAEVLPDNVEDKTVTWTSSSPEIATVDNNGTVTGISLGSATITASCGEKSGYSTITVSAIAVESVTITPSSLEMIEGETASLKAEVLPENADDKTVVWESIDESIATVDTQGNVTAIKPGKTKIMATCGNQGATCDITVSGKPVESVTVEPAQISLKSGEQKQLTATVLPEDAEDKTVTWESSDENVATVDDNGTVTAVAAGEAIITAKSADKQGTCEVSVLNRPVLGDFYYSDGTWSTELDKNKTPIGIVFYASDPSVDDATLRKDHPECVNGLVVSLDGEKITAWQPNYEQYYKLVNEWTDNNTEYETLIVSNGQDKSDRLNKLVGYNNTKAIEAFNAAPENASWPVEAVKGIEEYREKVPAPESTSDWYVPSVKELSLLCSEQPPLTENIWDIAGGSGGWYGWYNANRDFINSKIEQIEGALILKGDEVEFPVTYLSSCEIESYQHGSEAVGIFFRFGSVSCREKQWINETYSRVRYILAF